MKIIHKPRPLAGQIRDQSGFLLLPKTIGGVTRWLEFAKWRQRWQVIPMNEMGCEEKWEDLSWDD